MKMITQAERDYILSKSKNTKVTITSKRKNGKNGSGKTYYVEETFVVNKLLREFYKSKNVVFRSGELKKK